LVRARQLRQPGRAVIRVNPAQNDCDLAAIAGGRGGAQLQMQPADGRILRRQLAGAGDELQRAGAADGTA